MELCFHTLCVCSSCAGPLPADCLRCAPGAYRNDQGRCVATCPKGHYVDAAVSKCAACHHDCLSCVGPERTDCDQCRSVAFQGSCYEKCPRMTVDQNTTGTCLRCHDQCTRGCDGLADTDCNMCLNVILGGRCLHACPTGTYKVKVFDSTSDSCVACSPLCDPAAGCYGKGPSQCVVYATLCYGFLNIYLPFYDVVSITRCFLPCTVQYQKCCSN